jgi:molybdopterin converting factor small subunit
MLRLGPYKDGQENELLSIREFAIFVLNGKEWPLNTVLSEGDVISVFSPLSGG